MVDETMQSRAIGFYFVLTVVFVVAWNIIFGAGTLPQSTEERIYRWAFFGLHVSIGAALLWWIVRRKLNELDKFES